MSKNISGKPTTFFAALMHCGLVLTLGATSQIGFGAKKTVTSGNSGFQEPYGMAGCGLWSKIITSKNRDAQLGVSVLRVLPYVGSVDSQTSGITSGTSNCVSSRTKVAALEGETYVRINITSLAKETAQGSGQHIFALAEILGCPHATFAQHTQSRYKMIFKEQEPQRVFENYLREARSDKVLADQCVRLS
jgi:hypothetical protein